MRSRMTSKAAILSEKHEMHMHELPDAHEILAGLHSSLVISLPSGYVEFSMKSIRCICTSYLGTCDLVKSSFFTCDILTIRIYKIACVLCFDHKRDSQ